MFREMRRKNQSLSRELCMEILEKGKTGVLALSGDDGYPYALPMNYAMANGKIYFHSATEGHKIDAVRRCGKASLCVIDADDVDPAAYSTRFRSVIAFGRVRLLNDAYEIRRALMAIGAKYVPGDDEGTQRHIQADIAHTAIIELEIEHMTGKESRALAKERAREQK